MLLDDEDYIKIPKSGWYLSSLRRTDYSSNRKTRYAIHDTHGRMHRYILGIKDPKVLVDHIDGNGLNNQKTNLRIVNCSTNKKNQKTILSNKIGFNGVSYEPHPYHRIRVRWSEGESNFKYGGFRAKQKSKSFSINKYNGDWEAALKDAILFRIQKMEENDYLIDERSTTIKKKLLQKKPT